ncbi:MAG: hypothetical protein AAFQ74_13205 [Cyanobacteria bacterium J06623_4]
MNAVKPIVSSLSPSTTQPTAKPTAEPTAKPAVSTPHFTAQSTGAIDERFFQGAVFGLQLAPIALQFGGSAAKGSTVASPESLSLLTRCFESLSAFLQAPNQFAPELAGPEAVLNSVPILLRYCDHPAQRWQRLSAFSPAVSALCWVLGDALALTVQSPSLFSCSLAGEPMLTWIDDYAREYASRQAALGEDHAKRCQLLWSAIAHQVLTVGEPTMSATPDASFARFFASIGGATDADRQVAGGIASALLHAGDYGASVRAAACFRGVAPWVAGLVSGAMNGPSALPMLWQLQADRANVVSSQQRRLIAEGLYALWSGQWFS